jgi:sporulation protein YlmC with PRC-barrel domain
MRVSDLMKATAVAALLALPVLAQTTTPGAAPGTPTPGSAGVTVTQVDVVAMQSGWRASKVVGMDVYDDANRKIGSIDDLIITRNERVPVAVLSVGGFLGIGSKLVAVPFQQLRMTGDDKLTMPGATADSLKALPDFNYRS